MRIRRVQIDLNRRDHAGRTPARYYGETPSVGERVLAFEPEDGVCVDAVVAVVDVDRCRIALDVDWDSMRDDDMVAVPLATSGASLAVRKERLHSSGGSAYSTVLGGSTSGGYRTESAGNYTVQFAASA